MHIIFIKIYSSKRDVIRDAPFMTDMENTRLCAAWTNLILRGRSGWAIAELFS